MEGTSGLVERISTAGPSFSCTIRKLLIAATLLATREEAAGLESGWVVWERSQGAPSRSIPIARTRVRVPHPNVVLFDVRVGSRNRGFASEESRLSPMAK